jgi:hypothetical protein
LKEASPYRQAAISTHPCRRRAGENGNRIRRPNDGPDEVIHHPDFGYAPVRISDTGASL